MRASLVILACVLAISTVASAATFSEGDRYVYGTMTPDGRYLNGSSNFYLSSNGTDLLPQQGSMRFTSRGGQDITAVGLRLVAWDAVNDTVVLGIQADDGSGNPDGTYLASYSGAPTNDREVYQMDGTIDLTAGNVYHLVIDAVHTELGKGRVYAGRMNTKYNGTNNPVDLRATIPTQDMQVDTMWDICLNNIDANNIHGTGWSTLSYDQNPSPYQRAPAFGLYNGITAVNEGSTTVAAATYSRVRGLVERCGQSFKISDSVISAGEALRTSAIYLKVQQLGTPDFDLNVNIVKASDQSTVLATLTLEAGVDSYVWKAHALDKEIDLEQGVEYMMLAKEASTPGLNSMYYKFLTVYTGYTSPLGNPADGEGTYGGTALGVLTSTWAATEMSLGNPEQDWAFAFEGYVIPEPATMILLGIGGIGMLVRRRRS